MVAIILAVTVPVGLFIALSIPRVQNTIRTTAEHELTSLLGMNVGIGNVNIAPFSRITLKRVSITDAEGDTAICADHIGAGLNLTSLIFKRRMEVNYAEIIGLEARLQRDSAGAPLNIQPMIDALSPRDTTHKPRPYDLRINTVVIRRTALRYDVSSAAPADSGRFDPNHIALSDIRADLRLPRISNDKYLAVIRRMAFSERSGLVLESLDAEISADTSTLSVAGLSIATPLSQLSIADFTLDYADLKTHPASVPIDLKILPESHLSLPTLSPFVPSLADRDVTFNISGHIHGTMSHVDVSDLDFTSDDGQLWLRTDASIAMHPDRRLKSADLKRLSIGLDGSDATDVIERLTGRKLSHDADTLLHNAGNVNILGEAFLTPDNGRLTASVTLAPGALELGADYRRVKDGYLLNASIESADFDGAMLTKGASPRIAAIGNAGFSVTSEALMRGKRMTGRTKASISELVYNGQTITDVTAEAAFDGTNLEITASSDNPALDFEIEALTTLPFSRLTAQADLRRVDLSTIPNLKLPVSHIVSLTADVDLEGAGIDDITGHIDISRLSFGGSTARDIDIANIRLEAERDSTERTIRLVSDMADATLHGHFTVGSATRILRESAAALLPALFQSPTPKADTMYAANDSLTLDIKLKTTDPIGQPASLPIAVIYPVEIHGTLNRHDVALDVNAPYLQQKNRLLENTSLHIDISADSCASPRGTLSVATAFPTKKGTATINLDAHAITNSIDSRIGWRIDRETDFSGEVSFNTLLGHPEDEPTSSTKVSRQPLTADININPGHVTINDTVWNIGMAKIGIAPRSYTAEGISLSRPGQSLRIDGKVSDNPADSLTIDLRNANLDYVFETLDIPTAMFGGIATGTFHASSLLSAEPRLYTDGLYVDRLSYNHSLMGNTTIRSHWLADARAVAINAVVDQPNGRHSTIDGRIMPLADSLDFHFDADRIEVGFMLPFMEAFTSSVSGYASGKARLWGSFKYIDMVGDILAEDFRMKVDFTNTFYNVKSDTVRLTPGHIDLHDITLHDDRGHTALLNGYLDHEFFKQPKFQFRITQARDMLVYDVHETQEQRWFGRIFGNGSATVSGQPGVVDIGVNMSTALGSSFTFVLSDAEQAYDYRFITFRDRDRHRKDSIERLTSPPQIVKELKERIARSNDDGPGSIYKMNIAVDVNPSAQVTLVMDPVGGDRIRAFGNGNLRMTYDSANEDLRMFGTYTLTRGNYNFTLQDIIIKDFTIRDESSITFHGDPYAAQLDIQAIYSLNANLSDLDESFLQDKELNRTNVPVHALLNVAGDMRSPDISFDLEFPTLTSDTYRKVRSIVSTEDMMNRQIIYLLALNRFYTPDYMNATKGNEFVSVASSTISSQLSSILGQLSDNWSIAPNIRSDRGDFSDVEVDLALSSNLLNNRLLLNGNFGYRDKAMNSNTFIGDFDIEYLLNRTGTLRLRAYNRYNDRNYYLRSALTTQGVGVVFKRDFDNMFNFLRPKRHKQTPDHAEKHLSDSIKSISADSIPVDTLTSHPSITIDLPGDTITISPR